MPEPSSPKRLFTPAELKTPEVKAMLVRRQKQIDYGKNMACYINYTKDVPRLVNTHHYTRSILAILAVHDI